MRWDENNVVIKVLSMNVEDLWDKVRPKKRWMDYVKHGMNGQGEATEIMCLKGYIERKDIFCSL